MNLLVTGGAGFIGANFVRYWLGAHPGDRITVLDALTYAGNRSSLPPDHPSLELVVGDICDAALVAETLDRTAASLIVHFAAESHVDRSIVAPEAFLRTNVTGTWVLLEAARKRGIRFHHISTDEVYGSLGPDDPPFRETTAYAPNSPYSASKAAADHLVRAYVHTYGLAATASNCSNNYGPYHFPEKLIPLCITNLLRGRPLPVYGDGLNVRDWLFVEDHCRGIDLVISRGEAGETYNLGGCNEWQNIHLVREICEIVDAEFEVNPSWKRHYPKAPPAQGQASADLITFVRDRPGHDRRYAVDTSKARTALGYEPQFGFAEGLHKTVRWFLANENWWKPLLPKQVI